jgi:hypothetical protein
MPTASTLKYADSIHSARYRMHPQCKMPAVFQCLASCVYIAWCLITVPDAGCVTVRYPWCRTCLRCLRSELFTVPDASHVYSVWCLMCLQCLMPTVFTLPDAGFVYSAWYRRFYNAWYQLWLQCLMLLCSQCLIPTVYSAWYRHYLQCLVPAMFIVPDDCVFTVPNACCVYTALCRLCLQCLIPAMLTEPDVFCVTVPDVFCVTVPDAFCVKVPIAGCVSIAS